MEEKLFKLKGKTLVIIDWANVYGWSANLKWKVSPQKLYGYLKNYSEVFDIRFYFGVEKGNKKSTRTDNLPGRDYLNNSKLATCLSIAYGKYIDNK